MPDRKLIQEINNTGKQINILVDVSNLMYRSIFAMHRQLLANGYKDFRLFKHHVLTSIIDFSTYFVNPKVYLCFDKKKNGKYWRNDIYEKYKDNRKDQFSPIDKNIIYEQFSELEKDIIENLPWYCIKVPSVEADDIISVIINNRKDDLNIIHSPDKDFIQLQKLSGVYQFDPMKKIFLDEENPEKFWFEHIIKGDPGDGISNIFSDIDAILIPGKKQNSVRKTKLAEMWEMVKEKGLVSIKKELLSDEQQKRFVQNRKLIDLTMIPIFIEEKIMKSLVEPNGDKKKFWNYCVKHKMNKLSEKAMLL